jgi:ribosomal protein S18 acetylase RimI-like enzyme
MPDLLLVPMTAQDLEAFIDEEVADYAHERVLDGAWSRRDALERARAELARVITWEHEAVTAPRQRLLTAIDANGVGVGWLWVKLGPPGPWSTSAFLCQMTVARPARCRGYGRSMLAALESLLANEGITELRLNVCESNLPAKRLYTAAGFELADQHATMRQLRKRLLSASGSCEPVVCSTVAQVG